MFTTQKWKQLNNMKVINQEKLQFKFLGVTYECIGEGKEWQFEQLLFALSTGDYLTLKNRIANQLKWGPYLKII